jgi:hypothetical protein
LEPALLRLAIEGILKNSFARFEGQIFHQIKGTSMGTPCAPSIATLKVGREELKFLEDRRNRGLPVQDFYKRFLDDIFLIWLHGREALVDFSEDLNRVNENLRYTYEIREDTIDFLDIRIHKGEGHLQTEIFQKPTDAPSNLLYSSSILNI